MSRIDREFIEKLKELKGDTELKHMKADEIITEFLRKLTYDELAKEYERVPKWYS